MTTLFGLIGFGFILTIGISMLLPMMAAQPPQLGSPVDCELGTECFIQNYVDVDTSGQWSDYTCGPLSYDGHKGTDFRTRTLAQMQAGVNVLAVADGTVLRVRDDMPDSSIRDEDAPDIEGRECGNGLVIKHHAGLESQYCHLKQGSIKVSANQNVKRGEVIGQIGLSGSTEFPHLHLSLRNEKGDIIDPFIGNITKTACGERQGQPNMWLPQVREQMAYRPTGLLSHGFANAKPDAKGARNGEFSLVTFPEDAGMMIFWVDSFGLRDGDLLEMRLTDPYERELVDYSTQIEGNKAQWFQFIGKRLTEARWEPGEYTGHYRILRKNEEDQPQPLIDKTVAIRVEAEDLPLLEIKNP